MPDDKIKEAFEEWCKSNFTDEEIQFSLNYGSNKFMARGYYSGYKAGLSANETKIAIAVEALEITYELFRYDEEKISILTVIWEALQKIKGEER